MYEINQGKLTLIGPRLNLGGLHLSAYYFYLFAPFLRIGNFDHRMVLYGNATIFIIGFIFLYLFLSKKIGKRNAFLSILWIATTPYMILAARSPGNAFSYLIFLSLYLFFIFKEQTVTFFRSILIGLFGGIITNFHPLVVHIIPILFIVKIIMIRNKRLFSKLFLCVSYLSGFLLSFLPILIFDLRHNFITLKLIFDKSSYLEFFYSSHNLFTFSLLTKFTNLFNHTNELIPGSLIGLFLTVSILLFFVKKDTKKVYYYLISVISLILLTLAEQGVFHYYFPTILLFQMLLVYIIYSGKTAQIILLLLIAINLTFWPEHLYKPARNLVQIEKVLKKVISENFLPNEPLNVVLNNQTHLSKVGYEYRFLLAKNKYKILDEYSYKDSKNLLLISERGPIDWEKEGGWEWSQFGNKRLLKSLQLDNFFYYLFKKG